MVPGERRELNPRMVDSQSTALIHLATSAPIIRKTTSIKNTTLIFFFAKKINEKEQYLLFFSKKVSIAPLFSKTGLY